MTEVAIRETHVVMPTLSDVSAEEWRRLGGRRLFFGHQSVGENLIEGIADILGQRSDIPLRVFETVDIAATHEPGLYHARIGANGDPQSKFAAFSNVLARGRGVRTAFMKLCYMDLMAHTDPKALFEAYREMVEHLRAGDPELVIVHVTLPLTADRGTLFHLRTLLKGNQRGSDRHLNWLREDYNERLRSTYGGREPVFDLAYQESRGPDGRPAVVRYQGADVPVLARPWTYDGGHLNPKARRRMAEVLLVTLAKL